jgi:polysaccharide biosynthesis transport protein
MELQQYLKVLGRRWMAALVGALVVFGGVAVYTAIQTPTYSSTNRVFIQPEKGASASELNSGITVASQQIVSYSDLATSPLVLGPVIEALGLETTPAELATHVSTSVPQDTLILEIAATTEDPDLAAAIANETSTSLRARITELEASGEASTVELTVISPAVAPTEPSSPDVLRNVAIGLVLAVVAGIAAAGVRELLDNRVRGTEDFEDEFGAPVLAVIPADREGSDLASISSRRPQSLQAESYRDLRTGLQFMGLRGEARSVLVTSSVVGEGKSSTASNLAQVLGQSGSRVLLIDADLRMPSLAAYLGLEGGAGLTTALLGEAPLEDLVQPLGADGVDVLASGPIPPNPSELLGSDQMKQLLEDAAVAYDVVVIDTAPLLAVTDALVLSQIVGGTIVVAQNRRVRKQQLYRVLEKLDAVQARVLGVVVNRARGRGAGVYSYTYGEEVSAPLAAPARPTASHVRGRRAGLGVVKSSATTGHRTTPATGRLAPSHQGAE